MLDAAIGAARDLLLGIVDSTLRRVYSSTVLTVRHRWAQGLATVGIATCSLGAMACGERARSMPTISGSGTGGQAGVGGERAFGGSFAAGGSAGATTTTGGSSMPEPEPYPRTPADPELTKRLVVGDFFFLGSGLGACTNELPRTGDQWCALGHPQEGGAIALWVVNVTVALGDEPIACDGSSSACLRLHENLWTGSQLYGPSHPFIQRFDGNTLIFHADASVDVREPYEGPIYAWRPGWPSARQLTTQRGVTCTGHRRSSAVYCIDSLDVGPDTAGSFGAPFWQSFDLLAARLEVPPEAPLPIVERIPMPNGDALTFRAQLARNGTELAYSHLDEASGNTLLRWVSLTAAVTEPATVLDAVAGWVLANDSAAVYFLRDFDAGTQLGELVYADFPSGANVRGIAPSVAHIDPVGAFDDLLSDVDTGIAYDTLRSEGPSFEFLSDRNDPTAVVTVGVNVEAPRVSPNGAYSLFYQNAGDGWPIATVAKNDGSGACTLNTARNAETYGGAFTSNGQRVLWVEYGQSGSEEGWIANPSTCEEKTKFGDWVLGFSLSGDFVYFEGGDEADSTSFLQYARIPTGPLGGAVTPLVVVEHPRYPFVALNTLERTHLLFASPEGSAEPGLFAHGPLELGAPTE